MAQPPSGSAVGTSIILAKKNLAGVVTPQGLERPVSSLAENVQRVMGSFYDVHKALQVRKAPKTVIDPFKESKHLFRTECETLRQVLQSGYRHAVDFTSSCQRAPNDRQISAKRCQLSGKNVLRDLQDINRVYDRNLESFRGQESTLREAITPKPRKANSRRRSSADDIQINGQIPNPEILIASLYEALVGIQSSLRDLLAFWETHANFLTLIVNRQTNFPVPGEETKVTVELWTGYQAALLHSSSSISQSADAMSVDPAVSTAANRPGRSNTFPVSKGSNRRPSNGHVHEDSSAGLDPSCSTLNVKQKASGTQSWWKRIWTILFPPSRK